MFATPRRRPSSAAAGGGTATEHARGTKVLTGASRGVSAPKANGRAPSPGGVRAWGEDAVAAGLPGFLTVRNGSGETVRQKGRWAPDELASCLDADVVRDVHPSSEDADVSEWDSDWGDMPVGVGENGGMPPWRMGGPPEVILPGPSRVSRSARGRANRPADVQPVVCASPDDVGAAGVEARLRRWLAAHRAVHETRRMTLLRMLGVGLALDDEKPSTPSAPPAATETEAEVEVVVAGQRVRRPPKTPRGGSTHVNGIPLASDGRPVGLRANFPDPKYAAIDHHGRPLPLSERVAFHPKQLPTSKRLYHPLASAPGPRRSDGTWDNPAAVPKETSPLGGGDLEDGTARARSQPPAVVLTRAQFSRACHAAGVTVSDADVADVFKKHGVKPRGGYAAYLEGGGVLGGASSNPVGGGAALLDLERFADVVLAAPQRTMGAAPVRAGPLLPDGEDATFAGKIVYPPCRTGVFAPTAWDGSLARRSAEPPRETLELEWAYGVSVAGSGGMLAAAAKPRARTNSDNQKEAGGAFWVYASGALGVVFDKEAWRQHFFRGHDDDVLSLAVHPTGRWAATGQAGRVPVVCVWEVPTGKEVARIVHDAGDRGVVALAFGPGDGGARGPARLVTVSSDNKHTTRVWDWGGVSVSSAPRKVCAGVGCNGTPPQVRGAAWSEAADCFATFGTKHVKVWTPTEGAALTKGGSASHYTGKACSFGGPGVEKVDALCGAFLPGGDGRRLVTGHANGKLHVWRAADRTCERIIDAHGARPVRALTVRTTSLGDDTGLRRVEVVTAAAGGAVRRWEVVKGDIADQAGHAAETRVPREAPENRSAPPPNPRAVAASGADVMVATAAGDLWLVESADAENGDPARGQPAPLPLIRGHTSNARHVAWHPRREGVFAVAAGGARVVLRDATSRASLGVVWLAEPTPGRAVAVAFSPAREDNEDPPNDEDFLGLDRGARAGLMAVGMEDGSVRLVRLTEKAHGVGGGPVELLGETMTSCPSSQTPITALAFSPDGKFLAAGSHDRCVAVHAVVRPPTAPPAGDSGRSDDGSSDDGSSTSEAGVVRWSARRVARCRGHSSTVTAVDWSPDSRTLRSTCQGYEILHFDAPTGRRALGDFRDAAWDTWTAPIGFPVMGIYQEGTGSGTDINSVSRAGARGLVATGDDFGLVRLLHYPSVVPDAPAREQANAHSSHVACVRFSPDSGGNTWLVTAGGGDRGALQWRLVDERGAPLLATSPDDLGQRVGARNGARNSADDGPDDDAMETERTGAPPAYPPVPGEVPAPRPRESAPVYQARRMVNYRKNRMAELRAQMEAAMRAGQPDPRVSVPEVPPPGKVWGPIPEDPTGQVYGWVDPDEETARHRARAHAMLQ